MNVNEEESQTSLTTPDSKSLSPTESSSSPESLRQLLAETPEEPGFSEAPLSFLTEAQVKNLSIEELRARVQQIRATRQNIPTLKAAVAEQAERKPKAAKKDKALSDYFDGL